MLNAELKTTKYHTHQAAFTLTSCQGNEIKIIGWGNDHRSKYRVETICPGASGQYKSILFSGAPHLIVTLSHPLLQPQDE